MYQDVQRLILYELAKYCIGYVSSSYSQESKIENDGLKPIFLLIVTLLMMYNIRIKLPVKPLLLKNCVMGLCRPMNTVDVRHSFFFRVIQVLYRYKSLLTYDWCFQYNQY